MKAARIALGALFIVLALGWAGSRWFHSPSQETACAAVPLPTVRLDEEAEVRARMEQALQGWIAVHPGAGPFLLGAIWGESSWAAGEVRVAPSTGVSTEGTLVLAERHGSAWEVTLPGDPGYVRLLERGPSQLLPQAALDALRAQGGPALGDTQGLYYLPYSAGTSVLVTCVDCYPGHFPSVDLYSWGDRTLRAARDGTVVAWHDVGDLCCCQSGCGACNSYLVLDHGDGEFSAYLHMVSGSIPEPLRQIGAFVPRGTAIGIEGDVGYTCGSNRPEVGCGSIPPTPGQGCGRHVHFEVRDAPYPYGQRLRPRFQDVYDQTNPPTYYVEEGHTYVSGNLPYCPTPTPTATPIPSPTPGACTPPVGTEGVYLFSEAHFCGYFEPFLTSAPAISSTSPVSQGIRSLYLLGPYTATLYTAPHYQGAGETFLDADVDLSDNTVSTRTASVRVTLKECSVISPGIVLYSAPGYGGTCQRFVRSDPNLEDDGLARNVRSLRIAGPYTVTLYGDVGYSGPSESFTQDVYDLLEHPLGRDIRSLRVGTPGCNPQAEGVTLFALPGYAGECRTLVTATADLSATLGATARSIWLEGPFHAILYTEAGFGGTAERILVSDPDLSDNAVFPPASLQVEGGGCQPWREGVTLFASRGFVGACLTLRESEPDLGAVGLAGHLGSLHIRGPYRVTLYALPGFAGASETLDRTDADLTDNPVGIQAASVRIEWMPCEPGTGGVTLWAQAGYDGVCTTVQEDDPDLQDNNIGRANAFSVRVIGPYSATLYTSPGFSGTQAIVLGDLPDLTATPFAGTAASLRVKRMAEPLRLWNDLRPFALPLVGSSFPTYFLQDTAYASCSPDDPVLSCTGGAGIRTLWYRPVETVGSVWHVIGSSTTDLALALWVEGPGGMQEIACATGNPAALQVVLPPGLPLWLEASLQEAREGILVLQVWKSTPLSVYLPLILARR